MPKPKISASALGLKADSLNCPEGGRHEVPVQAMAVAGAAKRGHATCLKCGNRVHFVPAG